MKHYNLEIFFTGLLLALSMPAEAHPGHGLVHDFQAGFWHPLFGIDHLLVMVGVGLWAGYLGGAARGGLPAVFLAAMVIGASFAFVGIPLVGPEIWVAASVLAIGAILLGIPSKLFFNVGWVRRASLPLFGFRRTFRAPAAKAPGIALDRLFPTRSTSSILGIVTPASMQSNPPFVAPMVDHGARKEHMMPKDCADGRRDPSYVLAALFAFSHGYVHALEAGADSQKLYYLAGFLISTALLLGIGLTVGGLSARRGRWLRMAFGAVCAGTGLALLIGV